MSDRSLTTLVTGVNGFVAGPLVRELSARGDFVVGVDIGETNAHPVNAYHACNLSDTVAVERLIAEVRPDRIVHLAAVSSVGRSWQNPVGTFVNNTNIFLNIVEGVRKAGISPRILSVGSSEEYGNVSPDEMPIGEDHALSPVSPYAVARVAQEQLSTLYVRGFGLDVVMTRSFNQFGPGQRTDFFLPSMAEQIRRGLEQGGKVGIAAGDLSIVRDFLDVRDAVSAYVLLLERGVSGEVYNVCSGVGRSLDSVLKTMAEIAGVELEITVDPARIRPSDNRCLIGNPAKLQALGWHCAHNLNDTLGEILRAG